MKPKIKMGLSIDWDFFFNWVPSPGGYGYFYEEVIWTKYPESAPDSSVYTFWKNLSQLIEIDENCETTLVRNHHDAYQYFQSTKELLIFDFHSDCYKDEVPNQLNCGNWLKKWLEQQIDKKHLPRACTLVVPTYQTLINERAVISNQLSENSKQTLTIKTAADFFKNNKRDSYIIDKIHICSSPAWTPPNSDPILIQTLFNGCPTKSKTDFRKNRKKLVLTPEQFFLELSEYDAFTEAENSSLLLLE